MHTAVAQSAFASQHVKKLPVSDQFFKSGCQKFARRCGAKYIFKSKCTKHTMLGPLFEVEMSKKCTPLWREAHFQVKVYKTHHDRTTFRSSDVENLHTALVQKAFSIQNDKTPAFWTLLEVPMSKMCPTEETDTRLVS